MEEEEEKAISGPAWRFLFLHSLLLLKLILVPVDDGGDLELIIICLSSSMDMDSLLSPDSTTLICFLFYFTLLFWSQFFIDGHNLCLTEKLILDPE